MKILIWGIPCVGKTDIGKMLAEKLNYKYFDMNEIIKRKYGTIDNFHNIFSNDYERFKEKERIALEIINNNDNFVMTITLICNEKIVNSILNTDTISIELIDNFESIYERIMFYDENDCPMLDSKQYRDEHKAYYTKELKNDMTTSNLEYKNIPKFNINSRKFEDVIDELKDFLLKLYKKN